MINKSLIFANKLSFINWGEGRNNARTLEDIDMNSLRKGELDLHMCVDVLIRGRSH